MPPLIERPGTLRTNAWDGEAPSVLDLPARTPWAQRELLAARAHWLAPAAPVDDRIWQHPDVGWGLLLPDRDGLGEKELASADDAPPAIRRLLTERPNSPVLRYRPDLQQGYVRRYYRDRAPQDLSVQAPRPGLGEGRTPQYLLIYATPQEIPWAVQYALNMSCYVGRLDLTEAEGLDRYVEALLTDWSGCACDSGAPVVWAVNHGEPDITWLMAHGLADKLWTKFVGDKDLGRRRRLGDAEATCAGLGSALAECSPALVVTTSHGMTGPLSDPAATRARLGAPVDVTHRPLDLADLAGWSPSGAIWYAHACCSAGADHVTRYADLLPTDGKVGQLLAGVARVAGATVAPLARALLGAERPLRAFVGHVEPTFDWTLRDPNNKQVLTNVLSGCLYDDLYRQDRRAPIAWSLRNHFKEAGAFYGAWQAAVRDINGNVPGMRDWALYRQLAAMDRQTLVVLGDPTVALPPLKAA